MELICEECGYKAEEASDFAIGYSNRTLCVDCRQQEIRTALNRCAGEVEEILLIDRKELAKSQQCLYYMDLNEYDEHIENDIKEILKFYINDLKGQIETHEGEMKTYLSEAKKIEKDKTHVVEMYSGVTKA